MRCVVLQDANGGHLGFMLCSSGLDQTSGDCVFMAMPLQSELVDTVAVDLLFQRRVAGESAWLVVNRNPTSIIIRTPGQTAEMFLELDSEMVGHWGIGTGSDRSVVGRALIQKKAEPAATPDRGA